jgi:hypothetical protein
MLLFWGIVGILEALFLPGAAICALWAPMATGRLRFLAASFVFSLAVSYLLAFALLPLGLYGRPALLAVFLMSLGALCLSSALGRLRRMLKRGTEPTEPSCARSLRERKIISGLLIGAICLGLAIVLSFYRGLAFRSLDAILSWNGWAVSWASGEYPQIFGDYPQLMPIVMSVPYIMMESLSPQLFSILALNLFIIVGLLALYALKDSFFACGAVVAAYGTLWLYSSTGIGYADVLVGVLALLSLAFLEWQAQEVNKGRAEPFFLYAAFVAAAATGVMKQSGLMWWPWFVLIAYETAQRGGQNKNRDRGQNIRSLIAPAILSALLAVPWYIYNKWLIYQGHVPGMTRFFLSEPQLYEGRSFLGRAVFASFRYSYFTIFAWPAILGLRIKGFRFLSASSLFIMAGWAFFFSYGTGNLKFPVMLAFFPLGAVIQRRLEKGQGLCPDCLAALGKSVSRFFRGGLDRPVLSLALILALLGAVCLVRSEKIDSSLTRLQAREVLKLAEPAMTKRLDYLLARHPEGFLTLDGRLKQLDSLHPGRYRFMSPESIQELSSFGFLVLNKRGIAQVGGDILRESFLEDFKDGSWTLFIRKDILSRRAGE